MRAALASSLGDRYLGRPLRTGSGKDLGSSLARAGNGLPPLLAAFVASECLQALDYAHRRCARAACA
jgi:hypothetical protein